MAGVGDITRGGQAQASTALKVRSHFHNPPTEFDGCFTTFYHLEFTAPEGVTVTDWLQPEWANIRFFCGSAPTASIGDTRIEGAHFGATGPSSRACRFEVGATSMWGIGFLPMGWARLIGAEASALANSVFDGAQHPAFRKFAPLMDVLCNADTTIEEQYAAITHFMHHAMRPSRDDDKVRRAHAALLDEDLASVSDFADQAGMSIRTLERVCLRYFGFSPKLLMRRQRFMRSLTSFMLHRKGNWSDAMDSHYHDQAQFTREFREFMTMNPSEYAARDHPIIASFVEARARLLGSAAQTLDTPG